MQAGPYQLVAPNNIIFTVTNWSPKTRLILVPCGIPNDPVCNVQQVQNMPKPPNSEYAYVFNGPNAMTLTNQTGAIHFYTRERAVRISEPSSSATFLIFMNRAGRESWFADREIHS